MAELTLRNSGEHIMSFAPSDDERPSERQVDLDFAEIATILARTNPDGDAYDVLRDVLAVLSDRSREKRRAPH